MAGNNKDLAGMMQEVMKAFPVDANAMNEAFRASATLNQRLSKVTLEAAAQSTEISSKWTRDTLAKLAELTKDKSDPADHMKAWTELVASEAEISAEAMAAFAEVAKKVQMETAELMLAAGRDFSEDNTAAVKKATAEVTAAARAAAAGGNRQRPAAKVGRGVRPPGPPPPE